MKVSASGLYMQVSQRTVVDTWWGEKDPYQQLLLKRQSATTLSRYVS